jgi:hypothetical protein
MNTPTSMNNLQEDVSDTAERTLAERNMEAIRQQGNGFVADCSRRHAMIDLARIPAPELVRTAMNGHCRTVSV